MSDEDNTPTITVYETSIPIQRLTAANQNKIEDVLRAKKIKFVTVDIASCDEGKAKIKEIMGDRPAVAPQICNGDTYCGDFDMFMEANEDGALEAFLKLPAKQKVES